MKRRHLILVACVGAFALGAVVAPAHSAPPRSYDGANKAYAAGNWADAIAGYEALVAAGLNNRDLYFNLGNAYLRHDRLGPAIYNYERAVRLSPGCSDCKHNLAIARAEVASRWPDRMRSAEKITTWERIATYMATTSLTIVFLAINLLFFGGLIVVRLLQRGPGRIAMIVASVLAGMATVAVGVLLWANVELTQNTKRGVVLDDQLHMRDGAYEKSVEGALIHAGLRVRIIGGESGWVQIRLNNGHEGWVQSKSIGEL